MKISVFPNQVIGSPYFNHCLPIMFSIFFFQISFVHFSLQYYNIFLPNCRSKITKEVQAIDAPSNQVE